MKRNIEFHLDFALGSKSCPVCGELPCVCGSYHVDADEKAGYPPNCKEGFVKKDGKCVPAKKDDASAEKSYPGKSVPRRKDGVPKKKQKKRACQPGEHRDKGGKLVNNKKKSKAYYSELWEKVNADSKSK